ncbi:hypothetical protein [Alicyclobacillus ferrooxydans]|uniref:Uncharacterized protein n=1 Tax=Alicyclobacillus ferrooxydans TaxID=471514 RepID=A0A0P9C6K5_9BACL|nr:hypothetical protein [Alicyclobacillus ferrooxydans]KPV40756.1 hypothetical protein AN477_20755 [Alicyclobacillus ferrooxydans]
MNRWFGRLLVVVLFATAFLLPVLMYRPQVQAATQGRMTSAETLVTESPTVIPKNEQVEDVLVLGHNVTVEGKVTEILVVLDGNVHLGPNSYTGIVFDLGGSITQSRGAHVGAMYHVRLNTPFWNGALFGVTVSLLVWAGMLAVSVALVLLAVLCAIALRNQRVPLGKQDGSIRKMGLLGVLVTVIVGAVGSLLALTVVGLPVVGLIAILYLIAGIGGFSMTSMWIGGLVLGRQSNEPFVSPGNRAYIVQALIGSSLLMATMNIPFVGLIVFLMTWLTGIGAVTTWLSELLRARKLQKRHT